MDLDTTKQGLRFRIVPLISGNTYQFACEPVRKSPTTGWFARHSSLAAARLREKCQRRKKKERAFEEEGVEERESGEPWRKLVSTPFLDPNPTPHSLNDPDPGGNDKESRKEEDMEPRG